MPLLASSLQWNDPARNTLLTYRSAMSEMGSSPIGRLPEELHLKIFRCVEPRYGHMIKLRLVCKAFVPSATELLFEKYTLLFWLDEDGHFGEAKLFRLLKENSELAKLVKDVKITYAIGTTYDIQQGLGLRYHTMTAELYEQSLLSTIVKAFHTTEDEIPQRVKEDIKRFYEHFAKDLTSNFGYGEPRWDSLTEEVRSRLNVFSNVQSLSVQNAYLYETPLFSDIAKFWRASGLDEPWNIRLALAIVGSERFPWHFQATKSGLEAIQKPADSLAFRIHPFERIPDHRWETPISETLILRPEFFTHVRSLTLNVWPVYNNISAIVVWKPALEWARFIQKFELLSTLELINGSAEINFNHDAVANFSMFRDFPIIFLNQVRMPTIERLKLRGWAVHLRSLKEIDYNFPKLRSLQVAAVALLSRSLKNNLSMWYDAAETLGKRFNGGCSLQFDESPIMEAVGLYNDDRFCDHSAKGRIVAFLAPPALDVLSAVSHRTEMDDQLYQAYKNLVEHEQPRLKPGSRPGPYEGCQVKTSGMLVVYYLHFFEDNAQAGAENQGQEVTSAESNQSSHVG